MILQKKRTACQEILRRKIKNNLKIKQQKTERLFPSVFVSNYAVLIQRVPFARSQHEVNTAVGQTAFFTVI